MTIGFRKIAFRAAATGLLVSCLTLLSGCWNSKDIQNMAYVTAIGLDYADGHYTTYVQVLNFMNIARSEGVQIGKKVPIWIGKGEGETIVGSLDALYATSQLRLFWGHVKTVVVTEGLMRQGLVEAYNALNRYREIRYNVLVYGTKERMTDIFTQKSLLNMSPLDSLMYSPQDTYAQHSFIAPIQGHKAIAWMNEPAQPLMIPSLSITKNVWNEDEKHVPMFKISGAYFFNDKRLSGWLSDNELKGVRWAQHDLEKAFIQIPEKGSPVAMVELEKPIYSIRPVTTGSKVQYDVKVRVRGKLSELIKEASIQKLEQMSEETIKEQIQVTYLNGLRANCDVFKLREQLYRNHPQTWKRLKNQPLDEQSLRHIRVSVSIVNTGKYKGRAG
ncbi:Ger(x)C family spore germination protein [Paenibacillus kobensis]|uniref:Ger(x)C family spore germination protein n=1 Tax=Paenibacillus kobensis TaxID=59841 RepID=UPI0013E3AB22|nr:Ger(x)C family spore germination protein [Paenibacillus kobensis]